MAVNFQDFTFYFNILRNAGKINAGWYVKTNAGRPWANKIKSWMLATEMEVFRRDDHTGEVVRIILEPHNWNSNKVTYRTEPIAPEDLMDFGLGKIMSDEVPVSKVFWNDDIKSWM